MQGIYNAAGLIYQRTLAKEESKIHCPLSILVLLKSSISITSQIIFGCVQTLASFWTFGK